MFLFTLGLFLAIACSWVVISFVWCCFLCLLLLFTCLYFSLMCSRLIVLFFHFCYVRCICCYSCFVYFVVLVCDFVAVCVFWLLFGLLFVVFYSGCLVLIYLFTCCLLV